MIGESEVIVRGEHDDFLAFHPDDIVLGPFQRRLVFVRAVGPESVDFAFQNFSIDNNYFPVRAAGGPSMRPLQ